MDVVVASTDNRNELRASKRRRIKTSRYEIDFMENEEKMMLEQVNMIIS